MPPETSVPAVRRRSTAWWALAWLPAGAYLAWTLARIALHDSLTSISDDSSNYLVMARHYSPWLPESGAIRAVWPLQYFPPLFPLLLALSGAAHSLLAAHALVLVLGLAGVAVVHRFLRETLAAGSHAAQAGCLLLALLPGFAFGLQGILSEALYLVLSVAFLVAAARPGGAASLLACALLLAGAMLTRSAGIALVLALAAQAAIASLRQRRVCRDPLMVLVFASGIYLTAMAVLTPPRAEYGRVWQGVLERGAGGVVNLAAAQSGSLFESWLGFLLVYWRPDRPLPILAATALLVLALAGTALRLRENRLDAWYVAISAGILLAWPYPGQLLRLLFPLVPVLLGHAVWMTMRLTPAWRHGARWRVAGLAILLAAVLPSHAFLHGRLHLAESLGLVPVYEWLRKPDMQEARRELGLQNQMMEDFARMPAQVGAGAWIATYEPSYVALLGDRAARVLGLPAADGALQALRPGDAVLLTAIHPRMSRSSIDGLAIRLPSQPVLGPASCSADPLERRPASCLLIVAQ